MKKQIEVTKKMIFFFLNTFKFFQNFVTQTFKIRYVSFQDYDSSKN